MTDTKSKKIAYEWVSNNNRLEALCLQWMQQPVIALDTEFIRRRTFFPVVGLLQVADSHGVYLIDPLTASNFQPLKELFTCSTVTKVLHACSEDLEVFDRYLGLLPSPLFDTQLAAAFSGYGWSISYTNLIREIEGIDIHQNETCSDWLQRPLSGSQLQYAAMDVYHLFQIYPKLTEQLKKLQRLEWATSDCQRLIEQYQQADQRQAYYLKVKSAWKLTQAQLAILKALCEWREGVVRQLDIPRNRLIKDAVLWEMAYQQPKITQQLTKIHGVPTQFVKKYGEHCLAVIEDTRDNDLSLPDRLPPPLISQEISLLKQLKSRVRAIADSLSLPTELLARKKDLEKLIRLNQTSSSVALPSSLTGWRYNVVGQALIKELSHE